MKNLLLIALLGLMVSQVSAQKIKESEVPKVARDAFMKTYPAAKEVKWEKEEGGYEASFDLGKKDMSVVLDEMGVIKEVETEISKSELPKAALEALKKEYAGYKIEETAIIVSNGITTYEAEVEKGEKTFELIFDDKGTLLKKTEVKEKDEKD